MLVEKNKKKIITGARDADASQAPPLVDCRPSSLVLKLVVVVVNVFGVVEHVETRMTLQRGCFGRHIVQRRWGWPRWVTWHCCLVVMSDDVSGWRWGTWRLRGKAASSSLRQDGGGGDVSCQNGGDG
jgi:hypothetical protein